MKVTSSDKWLRIELNSLYFQAEVIEDNSHAAIYWTVDIIGETTSIETELKKI